MSTKFKLTGLFAITIMIGILGLVAVMPVVAAETIADGDLVKTADSGKVYVVSGSTIKHISDMNVFKSYGYAVSKIKTVVSLADYTAGAALNKVMDGTLIKSLTDKAVYVVSNGNRRHIVNIAAFNGLGYKVGLIMQLSSSAMANYTTGDAITSAATIPDGALVKATDSGKVYIIESGKKRPISTMDAFKLNNFQVKNILVIPSATVATITAGDAVVAKITTTPVTPPVVVGKGLTVALAANTPVSGIIPKNVSVEILRVNLTASSDGDVSVTGIKISAAGLGDSTQIDGVTIYNNGSKKGNSRDIDSNKIAQINFVTPIIVKAGTTETVIVKAKVTDVNQYGLNVAVAADISTTATVLGSFPIKSNLMTGTTATVGQLTLDNDGTLSNVKLGDKAATLAKFKVTANNTEDITLSSIILKKDSVSTASDSDFENLKLYRDTTEVASAVAISSKYLTFTLATPEVITKNTIKRFVVKGDVISGASKTIKLALDNEADINTVGGQGYSAKIVNSLTGSLVTINAGTVSIEKVNAVSDKIKKDTQNVEFGTFKITANSGKNVELSRFLLSILTTNDNQANFTEFTQIENVELYNKTNNTTYDLTYASGEGTKVYSNTSMGLYLTSGVTNELVVRADVKSTATNQNYTASIAAAYVNTSTQDVTLKETGNDTIISDITPNFVVLKKVTVQVPSVTFSNNALSAAKSEVVGSSDVEILNFNIKSGESSAIKLTELKAVDAVADNGTPDTITNAVVSEFKLWKVGVTLPLKTVSASQLASEEITFSDLAETIPANTSVTYKVTTSLVKDSNLNTNTLQYRVSGYSTEEIDKGTAIYDAIAENVLANGIITVGETGATSLKSARVVTLVGTGALYVSMDDDSNNEFINATKNTYSVANTITNNVAALEMKAINESIKVTKLVVHASENLNGLVTKLAIYDGTSEVGSTGTIAQDSTIDIALDKLVVPTSTKYYYLKATLSKIGKDATGTLDKSITFAIKSIEAQGSFGDSLGIANANTILESGEIGYDDNDDGTITASGTTTGVSKNIGILASRISNVELVDSYSGTNLSTTLSDGMAAKAAIIKVTTDASSNTEANGDDIKTFITNMKVKVAKSTNVASYTASIEKIGSSGTITAGTVSGNFASFASLSGIDYEITPSNSAYYLVKITPTFTADVTSSIEVGLDKLDGVAASNDADGANFTIKDASTATAKYPLRLSVPTRDGKEIKYTK